MRPWQKHQVMRMVCSRDIDVQASEKVGMGREAGRAKGARGGGSRKIWCCVETEECLYRWPLLCPMICLGKRS